MTCPRMGYWYWMNEWPKFKASKQSGSPRDGRRQVLAEWRGIDLEPVEKARARAAKAMGQVLPRVLSDLKLERRRADAEILKAWNLLIDPSLAAHAQPVNLHKGTLFVKVDHSVWLSELVRYRRKEILERLQHCFGKELIVRLSFRVG